MTQASEIFPGRHRRTAELARQLVHILSGTWAYLLRWSGPLPLILLALSALVFNLWGLPRVGGRWLWRDHEVAAGRAVGVVLYPLTVLVLLAVFWRRPEIAAAGWTLLAFADGMATVVGKLRGGRPLPWNPDKTWAGFGAYLVVGWAAVLSTLLWVAPGRYEMPAVALVAVIVSALGALLESTPQNLDDNLGVPILAAIFLWCCLESLSGWSQLLAPVFLQRLATGLAVNVALTILATRLATLSRGGALAACLVGTLVWACLSWSGYAVLVTFFVLGSGATKIGHGTKRRLRLAQGRGGRRRAANALANGGVAAACAVFALLTPHTSLFIFAFACSLAAAAADTAESEIGQIWGRPTWLITTLRAVPAGTDGGVSIVGTVAGWLAAALTVGVGGVLGLYPLSAIGPLSLLALAATLAESVVGATLERAGWLDNHGVNFVNTLLAALLGAGWASIMG